MVLVSFFASYFIIEWNMRLIVAANEFSDKGGLVFVVNSVTHPHQQSSLAVVGEAKIPFKRIMSAFQFDFEIPVFFIIIY